MLRPPLKFSRSQFVDGNMVGNLVCHICFFVLCDPVTCSNGHAFCRDCLQMAMTIRKQCPYCNVELVPGSITSNVVVRNLINEARVFCFTRAEQLKEDTLEAAVGAVWEMDAAWGTTDSEAAIAKSAKLDHCTCTWTGKLIDAEQNFKECGFAGVKCGFGCGAVVIRNDMIEHQALACANRAVPCTNVGCKAVMPHPMIASHKANDCPYQRVNCSYHIVGCNVQLLRKDINKHVEASANQHMLLLLKQVSEHDKVNRSLQQENQDMQLKIVGLEQVIQSLQQQTAGLQQGNQAMQQKITGLEERPNKQDKELETGKKVTSSIFWGWVCYEFGPYLYSVLW